MSRREYFDDPTAPRPNSLVPAASAVALNEQDEVLLIRRSDNDLWSIPGGAMEIGESISQTAVREVREETGLEVEVIGLVGIYSDPRSVVAYDDGEVRQQFSICFECRVVGGSVETSEESIEVRFVRADMLSQLDLSAGAAKRLSDYTAHHGAPVIA